MQYSMGRPRRAALLLLAVSAILPAACDGAGAAPATATAPGAARLQVTVTTTQIRSLTESVAGDRAEVRSLLKPGQDPHSYEATPQDVAGIAGADLVLRHGLGLDHWLDKVLQNAGAQKAPVTVTAGIPVEGAGPDEPQGDPHVWFDVTRAMTMTRNIRDTLIQVDPAGTATYTRNTDAYLQQLTALDRWITDQVATIPAAQRELVTNHDAFGYYVRRYGLTFVGSIVPTMDSSAEPSAQQLVALVQQIKTLHVRAIFIESSINPKLEQQIARDAGVQVVDTLYGDSLGPAGSPAYTYEGMMRYNTDTIVRALK
jgi:ABC-type Zn uptake system ZnuABC Zn-binding protein ZnuA